MSKRDTIQSKILDQITLDRKLAYWRFRGDTIVFTNGCFDLIHRGHIDYLAKAADLGDVLIIGLNTDASVKRLKGEGRPVNDELSRALVLSSMSFVTAVILFDEDTPQALIGRVQPDVLVKGADYRPQDIVGSDTVTGKGGEVVTLEYLEGFSTSAMIERIKKL
jgi:rfaE bifunctional protein nucleotidyltransferase chain/domain